MDFEKIRKIICIVGILVLSLIFVFPFILSQRSHQAQRAEAARENTTVVLKPGESPSATAPAKPSSRITEVNNERYKDAIKALALTDEILTKPQDSKERVAATTLLPELLELCFHKYSGKKEYDDARKMLSRLKLEFPDSDRTASVRNTWGRTLGTLLREAAVAKNAMQVDALFKEYREGGFYLPVKDRITGRVSAEAQGLEEYVSFKADQWQSLPKAERQQEAGLALAAEAFGALVDQNQFWQVYGRFRNPPLVYGEELAALGQTFAQKQLSIPAYNCYLLANAASGGNLRWAEETRKVDYKAQQETLERNDRYAASVAMSLAVHLQNNPGTLLTALTPDTLVSAAIYQVKIDRNRAGLQGLRCQLAVDEFLAESAPLARLNLMAASGGNLPGPEQVQISSLLPRVRGMAQKIEGELRREMFVTQLRDTNVNIWAKVPPQTMAEVEKLVPPGTPLNQLERVKRDRLQTLIYEGKAALPGGESRAFDERRMAILALDGASSLVGRREEAFRSLRVVLHEGGNAALSAELQQVLQATIRAAQKKNDFEALIELAGFYSAEFGEGLAADPFRPELRQVLESGAKKFKTEDKMKYVFVQAILATAFANEEIGRAAQQETVQKAFEVVQNVALDTKERPVKIPSGMAGFSSESVDNSTEYHILVVYDGPEKFAVLCNPYRKGSFALRSGKYRIAVITPIGRIRPYRAERTLADEHNTANYVISRSNEPTGFASLRSSSATGDYALLRPADDTGGVRTDPKTGMIRK